MNDDDEIQRYGNNYDRDEAFRIRPTLRSLISRGSKAVMVEEFDEETGSWRQKIKMSRLRFDDKAKGIFLEEYRKWGRMGESASAAGVTPQCVRHHMEIDEEFAQAMLIAENEYQDKLISHHQNLVFNGTEKVSFDRNGNIVSRETVYPIRLIELELKKHDKGYRDKQEVEINHTGGVLVAPAEMGSIDAWEKRFTEAKDVTPTAPLLGLSQDEEEEDPF